MRRTISIVGALILVACGGEAGTLFGGDGADGFGSSGDADAGQDAVALEDGAAGEDGAAPMVCAPGKVEACPCPGGGQGAQTCREDGSGWGPCECGDAGSGGAGGSGGAPADAGPDAPPDTSGWRWWCMHKPPSGGYLETCTCTYGASGNENVAACPPFNCCYLREVNGITAECHCLTVPVTTMCANRAENAGGVRVASCP